MRESINSGEVKRSCGDVLKCPQIKKREMFSFKENKLPKLRVDCQELKQTFFL